MGLVILVIRAAAGEGDVTGFTLAAKGVIDEGAIVIRVNAQERKGNRWRSRWMAAETFSWLRWARGRHSVQPVAMSVAVSV